MQTANSSTNVLIVPQVATPIPNVLGSQKRVIEPKVDDFEVRGKRPQYMCFIFGQSDVSHTPSATYTESVLAVPGVPASDYQYLDITNTINSNPFLFQIVTLIIADRFEDLLQNHPNTELVHSVCQGLRCGFWPFADTQKPESLLQGCVSCPHRSPPSMMSLSFLNPSTMQKCCLVDIPRVLGLPSCQVWSLNQYSQSQRKAQPSCA